HDRHPAGAPPRHRRRADEPHPPRDERPHRGARPHPRDRRVLPPLRLRAAPLPARALVLRPLPLISRAYGSAYGRSFALIDVRRDNLHMSSPSPSLVDRADSAQLNSWMSRVVLRPSGPDDHPALTALAALDGAPVPQDPVLLLEEDGHLRAARSLRDGATIS